MIPAGRHEAAAGNGWELPHDITVKVGPFRGPRRAPDGAVWGDDDVGVEHCEAAARVEANQLSVVAEWPHHHCTEARGSHVRFVGAGPTALGLDGEVGGVSDSGHRPHGAGSWWVDSERDQRDGEAITQAWDNALGFYDIEPDGDPPKSLRIGPDTSGNLLKLLYLQLEDEDLVIHTMPLRPVFRTHLTGEDR